MLSTWQVKHKLPAAKFNSHYFSHMPRKDSNARGKKELEFFIQDSNYLDIYTEHFYIFSSKCANEVLYLRVQKLAEAERSHTFW